MVGASLAVSKKAYWDIGGMDEEFVGWGGEDTEFWDRCLTRNVWEYAHLPIIHLWHKPQPEKRTKNGQGELTADLTLRQQTIPPRIRIDELLAREKSLATKGRIS